MRIPFTLIKNSTSTGRATLTNLRFIKNSAGEFLHAKVEHTAPPLNTTLFTFGIVEAEVAGHAPFSLFVNSVVDEVLYLGSTNVSEFRKALGIKEPLTGKRD